MAGLSAAWRLSEPGWQDRFESITVYQRGWRLGGKGASSRGEYGRIEEHGLHIWLGSYENAFRLLRECYAELDRATTNPGAPIQDWRQAMVLTENPGLAELQGDKWTTWLGTHPHDDRLPGDSIDSGRELSVVNFIERAVKLVLAFADSLRQASPSALRFSTSPTTPGAHRSEWVDAVQRGLLAAMIEVADQPSAEAPSTDALRAALDAAREAIEYEQRADLRRAWVLISLVTATVRGLIVDNMVTDPRGFRAANDVDFCEWIIRHGGHRDVLESPLVRGVYDLVFAYEEGDPDRPACAAGLTVFLIGTVLFGYRGAIFWKMTAGMGDVVIAPLYQALRSRGVDFEFFHRVDALHLDAARHAVEAISVGRQLMLADGVEQYQPLTTVNGLPVFPSAPLDDQVVSRPGASDLESHFGDRHDADRLVLRRGVDFDDVVLAVSIGMIPVIAREILEDRPEWTLMTERVRTVATQAFQLWLRRDEAALGWHGPGATVSAYLRPFETWASMPQTLWTEAWPDSDRPEAVAYFCGSLNADWPTTEPGRTYLGRYRKQVKVAAAEHVTQNLGLFFPNAFGKNGFDWRLLTGVANETGMAALETQHVSVNVDPSDRYVQCVPGSDAFRLRPDESGYDNLYLAGDWTDCGLNAGCIEAAVVSGLECANAVLGHGRFFRIRGYYLP